MNRWDAVVVGAGPAGSVTAMLLARRGARVLLLDRARFPRDKPCSEYLTPETTRGLERLGDGILGDVEAKAPARLTGMKLVTPDGTEAV
ncbi:MAG TPA: FAD-dependent oxidoreductase, partial [Gemmatimonadales bacterium]